MKKLSYLFTLIVSLLIINGVKANTINDINMDIYVDKFGNAHVTEVWDAYLNQGTEGYRSYGHLGNAKITNFKVTDGSKTYEMLDSWNSSLSFENKAYKAGIISYSDKVELCWGISKYGSHIYKLTYDIEGFVAENEDSQIIYWELIPSELTSYTDNVKIRIHSDEPYSDTLPVWGYGNEGGLAFVSDGYIEMSNDLLGSGDYMTILVKFDKGTFETSNIVDHDFEYYHEMAEKGATHYTNNSSKSSIFDVIEGIIAFIFNVGIWFFIIIVCIMGSKPTYGTKKLKFSKEGRKLPKNNDLNMFRDLPCGKDIKRAYWLAAQYGLVKKKTDFLGAMLLKWIKEKKVTVENDSEGTIFKRENTKIIFNTPSITTGDIDEDNLYKYMYQASKDGILENKEFEKWCSVHYSKMLDWFDKVIDSETEVLVSEGKITKNESKGLFGTTTYFVDDSMKEEAIKVAGLKKFFKEFDNMTDKEAIDVMLWEEYLMYAQIFGVAQKVAKQFKKLYPDVITDYDYNTFVYINTVSYSGISSASSARSRAESYSSGGGGFSSGGGGGGSFGGGGGGGFR